MSDEQPNLGPRDTGDVAEVPADQRSDVDPDDDPSHTALEGGADDDLGDVYDDPGYPIDVDAEPLG